MSGAEAGVLASKFFFYNKLIAFGVLGLFTPSFEVPDFTLRPRLVEKLYFCHSNT